MSSDKSAIRNDLLVSLTEFKQGIENFCVTNIRLEAACELFANIFKLFGFFSITDVAIDIPKHLNIELISMEK
eukprot:scaffold2750_cov178-Ochromonas_danica.AAC.1